jgi:hypothetical protein
MSHASAIMRVLTDGLISIFAGCLSPAAGRGNGGLSALPPNRPDSNRFKGAVVSCVVAPARVYQNPIRGAA